jgi:hypothetical protein
MSTITSANAIVTLAIVGLFDTPVQLQGYSADDIFTVEPRQTSEVLMGVDGILSAGFVCNPTVQNISLQADSNANDIFDQWVQAMKVARDVYFANATVVLLSINRTFTCTKGSLTSYPPISDAARVLRPRRYTINWEDVSPAPTT